MRKFDFDEFNRDFDMEFLFERESISYKVSRGVSGMQANLKTCPACGHSKWRFYFGLESGMGNCFVCGETFSKIRFVKEYFGLEWRDVFGQAEMLLREQGWRPKRIVTAAVEQGGPVKLPYSLELPLPSGENLLYLENRGVTGDYARYFHLRWCEYGFWSFTDEDGKVRQQHFDNRVIIPVYDLDGELKTFQGRDLSGASQSKYLFPKMLPGTGRYLFNGQNVHLTEEIAVGEGAFDVIAMKRAFDDDVATRHVVPVGTFGKHLSYGSLDGDDQLGRFQRLRRGGVKLVTIMWDGEEKALVAALDAAKLLASIGLTARIALLPDERDPNEVLPEEVRKAYFEAQTWSPALDIRWRLQNPYRRRVHK